MTYHNTRLYLTHDEQSAAQAAGLNIEQRYRTCPAGVNGDLVLVECLSVQERERLRTRVQQAIDAAKRAGN